MPRKPTILVCGMVAGDHGQGGAAWAVLQYVLGFRALGCDVCLVEPITPKHLSDRENWQQSASAAYFRRLAVDFGLVEHAALILNGTTETIGLDYSDLCRRAKQTDVLVNISGMLTDEKLLAAIPVRIYLDLDPAFIQLWQTQGTDMRFDGHTHFVTVGLDLASEHCDVPTCGYQWLTTLQPVVLAQWPQTTRSVERALIAIGNWRSYGSVEHGGQFFGQKVHSVRQMIDLPRRTNVPCRLAMSIHPKEQTDLQALRLNGWKIIDPGPLTYLPADYQQLITNSWAELGIAKNGYVVSRCGWFSDRSACFLASGRPVIAQDTGFARHLPTGKGLHAFNTQDDILGAIESLQSDYRSHCATARQIANEYFDSNKVLGKLLHNIGVL